MKKFSNLKRYDAIKDGLYSLVKLVIREYRKGRLLDSLCLLVIGFVSRIFAFNKDQFGCLWLSKYGIEIRSTEGARQGNLNLLLKLLDEAHNLILKSLYTHHYRPSFTKRKAQIFFLIGTTYENQHNIPEAVSAYTEAEAILESLLECYPTYGSARRLLAEVRRSKDRIQNPRI